MLGNKLVCQCGECEESTFTCPNCRRNVPWCYGAADDNYEYCDECVTGKFGIPPIPKIYFTLAIKGK